jgi:glycoside/pentoside/hexuronide:cation symporter, GPH family
MSLSPQKLLTRPRRMGYGMAEIGITGSEVLVRIGLLIFYTNAVGLRSDLAGYAIALSVFWDAITDPIMGKLSDHLSIKGQRRRPFIALGSLLLSISLLALFYPPQIEGQAGKFIYLLLSYMFFNTSMTIIAVPHSAFAGDLTSNEEERTELFGWRLLFANLGLILGSAIPGIAIVIFAVKSSKADQFASIFIVGSIIISAIATLIATRGRDKSPAQDKPSNLLDGIFHSIKQRNFQKLLLAYFVANIGLSLNSALALYYYNYSLELPESQTRLIIAIFILVFSICIPLWIVKSKTTSKRLLIFWNILGLGVMTCFAYPLFPSGNSKWPLIAAIFGGIFIAVIVLLDVAVADEVDRDIKGEPSAFGAYFGVWKMAGKVARAFALAASGQILHWIQFVPNTPQTEHTAQMLRYLFGPGVGVFLIAAAFIILTYIDIGPVRKCAD